MKTVLFILLDRYADWEAAPLASVINRQPGWRVQTVSPAGSPVRSLGGFTTVPEGAVPAQLPPDCAGVVLIGGLSWRTEAAGAAEAPVRDAAARGIVIGAICDATVFLGRIGLLNDMPHTGNLLPDLQDYAGNGYSGSLFYRNENVVRSGRLVTANGTAAMEFAREMAVALELMNAEDAARWHRLFTLGFHAAPEDAFWWFGRMNSGGES